MSDDTHKDVAPWLKRDSETDKAYSRFCVYRDMGPDRSLEKVRQECGRNTSYIRILQKWSSEHDWVVRAAAYDEHLVQIRLEEKQRMAVEVYEAEMRHYRFLLAQIDKLKENIETSGMVTADSIETMLSMVKKVDDFGRRAVSLPDRYTQSNSDITTGGKPITWESFFVGRDRTEDTDSWGSGE